MKKQHTYLSVLAALLFSMNLATAQSVFNEDFENGGIPQTFTLIDNDGLTPANNVSYFTNAWIGRNEIGGTDSVAASTSWYDPAGASDDWLITPAIAITTNSVLTWNAKAVDADYRDGYQVLISTTGTTINDFTDTLLTVAAEDSNWIERTIDLQSEGYTNTTIYIAFQNNSNDMFILLIDDIIVRNVPAADVSLTDVSLPVSSCVLTAAENISVTVKNTGLNAVSNFSISYLVNGGTPVTETYTDTIQPNATADYTFTQTADLSVSGTQYNVQSFVTLSGDGDASNDTSSVYTTYNVASTDVDASGYASSFETFGDILGWSTEDVNNDGYSWNIYNTGQASDGAIAFMYIYNAASAAEDWLYSTCLDISADTAYKVNFFYKVGTSQGTIYPEKFSLHYGNNPSAGAMTNLIKDYGEVNNDTHFDGAVAFKPTATGTNYIGVKCYSAADQFYLLFDQFSIEKLAAPTASFTHAEVDLSASFNTPNGEDQLNTLTWDFGDDTIKTGTGSGIIHTYAQAGTYYVCLTVSNLAGSDTYCDSVTVTEPVAGISKINNNNLMKIFPNPSAGKINIVLNKNEGAHLVVTNTIGTVLLEDKIDNAQHQINLEDLSNGIYFVKIEQGNEIAIKKITIAK
jgi:PKD repeat protein